VLRVVPPDGLIIVAMSQYTYSFQQPIFRRGNRAGTLVSLLLFGTCTWVLLYAGLGWRFWVRGVDLGNPVDAWLLLVCVAMGAGMVLAWRSSWPRLRRMWHIGPWPALSLAEMYELSPSEFEMYVAQRIFARRRYHVDNTRDVKDGGIDILVTDHIGQRAVVQCKRYRGTVGESVVRDLYGTMIHNGAVFAYLVTTGTISQEARIWAAGKPIQLVDGGELEAWARAE
jgi:restriction system protein